MSRIWDISQKLHGDMPVWPGEPRFALQIRATIGDGCPVNVGAMLTPLHAGTHADAPLHYDDAGASSAECDLLPYIGPCIVMDVRHARGRVELADIDWDQLGTPERVLFRTYEHFPHAQWGSGFTAISGAVVARLGAMSVRLIGTDAASLDPEHSKTLDAHHAAKTADMRILEGLVLDEVAPGAYELIALPLRIVGADASPVRAILREMP
jgi:arylformamidase